MGMLASLCSDSKVSCCWKVWVQFTIALCLLEVVKKKKENRFTRAVLSALFSIRWRQLIQRPPNFLLSILEEDWHNLRNEFERALHAGSVMEKTLLESSQIESHQQNFGSVVRIRHGELKLSGGIEVMVLDVSYMHVT